MKLTEQSFQKNEVQPKPHTQHRHSELSHTGLGFCAFSKQTARLFRNLTLFAATLPAAGCMQVGKVELTDAPPQASSSAPELPSGPHWEKPIVTTNERGILVKNGDQVEAGRILISYSNEAIRLLEIQLERAHITLQNTLNEQQRLDSLKSQNAIAQAEFDSINTALAISKLNVEELQIRLEKDKNVRAPFSGTVRIDATSNSPSVSVYPHNINDLMQYWSEHTSQPE